MLDPKKDLWIQRLAAKLQALFLHPDALLVIGAAGLSRLGFQPQGWFWASMAGFALWLAVLHRCTVKRALWLGYLFGLFHFSLSFTWLIESLSTNSGAPWIAGVLGVVGLAAVVAIYPMLVAGALAWLRPRAVMLPIVVATLWVCAEWLRGYLFTGFPWNQSGMIWMNWASLIQVADLGGIYLLSFLALLMAGVIRVVFDPTLSARLRTRWLVVMSVVLTAGHLYGEAQLQISADEKQYRIALVQGGVPQLNKWDKARHEEHLERYLDLTMEAAGQAVDLVVWPETALAYFLQSYPARWDRMANVLRTLEVPLLFGVPHAVKGKSHRYRYYNALALFNQKGDWIKTYHKHHLVPFGEYVPLRGWLPDSIAKLTAGKEDFSMGVGPQAIPTSLGVLGPLVCYEVIFPAEVRQLANQGVELLINATNDAWFGHSAKTQHLQMARLRAIENRLPLVRVANTGISASFDAYGRTVGTLPSNQPAMAIHTVNHAPKGGSFYRRWGAWELWFWSGLLMLSILAVQWGRWRRSHSG
ncbi:apolipoprotein N-acyltransferase [Magnetococcus sp. PR-3]|uniref:apolipoprotein N-acyltransferase n=1 Tax=Magnetococcus sp. PR-3 TaxID=3120355 RepID=UPI002FCE62E7